MFHIKDWMGNKCFVDKEFETFEDGWEFLTNRFQDEEDWQEYFVEPKIEGDIL